MGWLWSVDRKATKKGWRPGAIPKPIKNIMEYFLKDGDDTNQVSPCNTPRKKKNKCRPVAADEKTRCIQKPTLHILKKKGEYIITLRPLKDPNYLQECEDPYLDMDPLQFKIARNAIVIQKREAKRKLLDKGFPKCTCHRPVACCSCRPYIEKKQLEYDLGKICCDMGIESLREDLVFSDITDSDSDLDIEFTPPVGLVKPSLGKKPDLAHIDTQYSETDWNIRPVFTPPVNKYLKPNEIYKKK